MLGDPDNSGWIMQHKHGICITTMVTNQCLFKYITLHTNVSDKKLAPVVKDARVEPSVSVNDLRALGDASGKLPGIKRGLSSKRWAPLLT